MEPSFFLSYWRPWNEDSSLIDSWGDYLRDKSLVDYGTDKIGSFIQQASRENVQAIEEASQKQAKATIASGMLQAKAIQDAANKIGFQLSMNRKELSFLNRKMDFVIEQNQAGLLLQKNIADVLKLPDSEKERLQAITLGIQFFHNASKDPDLFDDALEEFLKAESLKKQDFFVLNKIGSIYLYVEKHFDVQKACDYYVRAGKYASIESDPNSIRLANLLTNSVNEEYTSMYSNPNNIRYLAGDSYEKAALASYIKGNDDDAIRYQEKALSFSNPISYSDNKFRLAKYLIRKGDVNKALKELNSALLGKPEIMHAIFCDIDMLSEPEVISLANEKYQQMEMAMHNMLAHVLMNPSDYPDTLPKDIFESETRPYAYKAHLLQKILSYKAII